MRISDPLSYWRTNGYVSMIPSIHLPTTHDADDLIHVWLRIADGKLIDAEYLAEQERWALVFPTGTRSDRVEYFRIKGPEPTSEWMYLPVRSDARENWTVADVRGTVIADGGQRFHVLRPVSGQPHAALVGRAWQRGDEEARQAATEWLLKHVSKTDRPGGRPPLGPGGSRALARLNHCAHCHTRERPRGIWRNEAVEVERATDTHGFFVPHAVLSDDCVVANHRPRDLNADDPFVSVLCGDEPARLVEHEGSERYTCPGGRVPMGHREVEAALAAGHEYTMRMCESRRWLYEHMTDKAKAAFAAAFEACGIGARP